MTNALLGLPPAGSARTGNHPHGAKLPPSWASAPCADLCTKIQDGTHFSPKLGGGDHLYVTSKHVRFGWLDTTSADRISEVEHRKIYARCDTRKGDLLLTKDGANTGNAAVNDLDEEISLLSSVAFLRFDPARHDPRFFLQYILSEAGQQRLKEMMSGNAITRLTLQKIRGFWMPVPELNEQRAIAEALLDMDELVRALEVLIAKKRAVKQGVMQQLLTGKTRLPGFSGEWETARLGRIGSTYGGLSGKNAADFGVGAARYVTFLNVLENVVIDNEKHEHVRVPPGESQNPVQRGDVLFNGTSETPGDLAMGAVLAEQQDNLYLNSFCFGFRIHDQSQYHPLFLAYYFRGPNGRTAMHALAQGATRYNMSKGQFLALALYVPCWEEQSAISTVLSNMDDEIAVLEQRRDKTRAIKQGLMQQLLSGRTRLVEPVGTDTC